MPFSCKLFFIIIIYFSEWTDASAVSELLEYSWICHGGLLASLNGERGESRGKRRLGVFLIHVYYQAIQHSSSGLKKEADGKDWTDDVEYILTFLYKPSTQFLAAL